MVTETMVLVSDSELVEQSLSGDRDAFGRIVSRYQALVCSLAYSATGSLGQSEDLAQETFITAWHRLGHLRERQKLRTWLCGIARNRINNALRREGREPLRDAEPLESLQETTATEPLPREQAISNEEAAILWRSLERIPQAYREPLILFYRERQSIETVAEHLELTEDAVKQRLSRGRKLLQEQVLAFVEGALERTNPGKAFTLAVVGLLPALAFSAKAATVGGTVAKSATVKTASATSLFGMLLGPLVVLVPQYLSYRLTLASAHSDEERRFVRTFFRRLGAVTLASFIPLAAMILWLTRNETDHSDLPGLVTATFAVIFLPTALVLHLCAGGRVKARTCRVLMEEYGGVPPRPAWEYRSRLELLGLPVIHIRLGDRFGMVRKPVVAWIAVGQRAIGGLFAFGAAAVAPVSIGGLALGGVSLGGGSVGVISLGAIAFGVWTIFGGLLVGWQALCGCFAFGWRAAAGNFSVAHDFALGRFALAAQANNEDARQFMESNFFARGAEFINDHWLWLNLFWLVPFLILWLTARKQRRQAAA